MSPAFDLKEAGMSTPQIVTANYLNRADKNGRWLIRSKGQQVDTSKAFNAVIANGVAFKKADMEAQYGCQVVAFCETAEGMQVKGDRIEVPRHSSELREVNLRYCDYWFEDTQTGEQVDSLHTLVLHPNGTMTGLVPA